MFKFYLTKKGVNNLIYMAFNTNPKPVGVRCSIPINGLEEFWDNLTKDSIEILGSFYISNPEQISVDTSIKTMSPFMVDYCFEFETEEEALYFKMKIKDEYISYNLIFFDCSN